MNVRILILVLVVVMPTPGNACQPDNPCEAPLIRRYPALANRIGVNVEREWIDGHIEAIHQSFEPGCEAYAGCLAVWGNPPGFCRQLLTIELRSECNERWDVDLDYRGWQQCKAVADIYGQNQYRPTEAVWPEIQACAADRHARRDIMQPVVEIEPSAPEPEQHTDFVVRAFDPETGFPVYGLVTARGIQVGPTFQSFEFQFRFDRVTDELGRVSFRLPIVAVSSSPARGSGFPGFPETQVTFSTPIPATRLEVVPPAEEWTTGENVVTIVARDATTGDLIAGRIMTAGRMLGDSGVPVTITLEADGERCGAPVWFRAEKSDRPDESLPISPCR